MSTIEDLLVVIINDFHILRISSILFYFSLDNIHSIVYLKTEINLLKLKL